MRILRALRRNFENALVTNVITLADFNPSDELFRNYYAIGPERPFCKTSIDPKLALLRKRYAKLLKPERI